MIVPMVRALVACQQRDRDRLLQRLHELGVLHIVPVHAPASENGDERGDQLKQLDTALQVLRAFQPHGPEPRLGAAAAAHEVLAIWHGGEAVRSRLDALYREAEQLRLWGDVRVEALRAVRAAGIDLQVAIVPGRSLGELRGRVIEPLDELTHHRRLVAAIDLDLATLPPAAELVPLPERDRHALQAEAAALEKRLDHDRQRLAKLAWLAPRIADERARVAREQDWAKAVHSGLAGERVYAVQGWLPAERAGALGAELSSSGLTVALRITEPVPADRPPTLVRYRRWARPIDGLFRTLGMVPGYRELDVSAVFMVAVPLFAGMIIGDAGYGLLFALTSVLARRPLARVLARDLRILVGLFGGAALVWGALTGVWFGLTPAGLVAEGGAIALLGRGLGLLQVVRGSENETRTLLIQICFVLGAAHLILAHARRLFALVPDPRALMELGWCIVLAAMLGVIWILFFGRGEHGPLLMRAAGLGLATGLALVVGFSHPEKPIGSRIGMGLAGSLLPMLGTFSDTLSYIRLMAVGLASYYLGSTFNLLAANTAHASSWLVGGVVLLAGHSLNIGLILIAIFAHGVRLNVLEFSSNAGVQWAGYAYAPFSDGSVKESQ
ncbi:MAG TPA: hypothetical protein VK939_11430 [Longimicrobiales bacterium]|nr:hypothetical protein [Longimicrobiales bacterium]